MEARIETTADSAPNPSGLFLLPQHFQLSQKAFLAVVPAPVDFANANEVLAGATLCSRAFLEESGLIGAAASLADALRELEFLEDSSSDRPTASGHIFRSLRGFPTWALLLKIVDLEEQSDLIVIVGGELVFCLVHGVRFRVSLAKALLDACNLGMTRLEQLPLRMAKLAESSRTRTADWLAGRCGFRETLSPTEQMRRFFRARLFFSRETDRQAIPDRHGVASERFLQTSAQIARLVLTGEQEAVRMMASLVTGIAQRHFNCVVLRGADATSSPIEIDLATGCVLTDLDVVAPGRAVPLPGTGGNVPASGIVVRPMPEILRNALSVLASERKATTLAELFCEDSRQSDLRLGEGPLSPTPARMLNGIASAAISLGIDRYLAALVTNDFRVEPTGRFYYARASREQIWNASQQLFDACSWGKATSFVGGLDCGSSTCPSDATVARLFVWMRTEVEAHRPPKRYRISTLISFHNTFARYVGTQSSFLLALRETAHFPAIAQHVDADAHAFSDKECGQRPGKRPVLIAPSLQKVLALWREHCVDLDRRVAKALVCTSANEQKRRQMTNDGAIFVLDDEFRPRAITTSDLFGWWPANLGLTENWPRKFWQPALLAAGVQSSIVDSFARHTLDGCDPHSSTAHRASVAMRDVLSSGIEAKLLELGITPLAGLTRRRGHG